MLVVRARCAVRMRRSIPAPALSRSRANPATPCACRTASATDRPDGTWPIARITRVPVSYSNQLAAGLHDALARRQQGLGRGIAERDQHVRIHQFDLALDERQADLRLLRRRRAVAGRPPGNDIGDVGVAAVEPDRGDHPVQQFARTADERQALEVLLAPGSLADEHDPRLRVAVGEHQPRGGRFQRAAVETFQERAQRLERRRGARRFPRRQDRGFRRRRRFGARGRDRGSGADRFAAAPSRWRRDEVGIGQPVDRLSVSAQSTPASR